MNKRILIVSSRGPAHSAGLGNDLAQSLSLEGCTVDFLGPAYFRTETDEKYNYGELLYCQGDICNPHYQGNERRLQRLIDKTLAKTYDLTDRYSLMYPCEWKPSIPNREIGERLKSRNYDLVITLFWQDMLNSSSVAFLRKFINAPLIIFAVDMSPISGGCFYFSNCKRYKEGCGFCPIIGINRKRDASRLNHFIKRLNYRKTGIYYYGNTWMIRHARESNIFPDGRFIKGGIVLNENVFTSDDRHQNDLRKFTILLRSSSEPRKGNHDILTAVSNFMEKLNTEERERIEIISIGDSYFNEIAGRMGINTVDLGFVDRDTMIDLYRKSSVFISLSTDDAGPSMVNQAMMCGCPVIAYNIGCAEDMVIDGKSGYKYNIGDTEGCADGLTRLFNRSTEEIIEMSKECREVALRENSMKAFASKVLSVIN